MAGGRRRGFLAGTPDPWPARPCRRGTRLLARRTEDLRERDSNWVDESGDARIVGPSRLFVVDCTASRAAQHPRREAVHLVALGGSPSQKRSSLTRTSDHEQRAAELTDFSPPQISRTLAQFDKRGGRVRLEASEGAVRFACLKPRRASPKLGCSRGRRAANQRSRRMRRSRIRSRSRRESFSPPSSTSETGRCRVWAVWSSKRRSQHKYRHSSVPCGSEVRQRTPGKRCSQSRLRQVEEGGA